MNNPTDKDFDRAGQYYAAKAFGQTKDFITARLKDRYEKDDYLDPLVHLFAQHRIPPEDHITLPLQPTEVMWGGLARQIVLWMDMDPKTPRVLFNHLRSSGEDIPQWLRDEPEMQNLDHVPSKGTRVVLIYKAMIHDFQKDKINA